MKAKTIDAVGQRILLAFHGRERPPDEIQRAIQKYRPAGISLFRSLNIENPGQLRELNEKLQWLAQRAGLPPFLIATDQEGGQLMAIGDATPLPGNMAIGATGSDELARQAGEVLGRELKALGVNVNYAPCVDVNINPNNPVVGIRSFGERAGEVARLGAAMVKGMQSQGVAATAKHFPGHGDTERDTHHGLARVPHSRERLRQVEFLPFQSAISAGVKLIMSAHLGLPALDGEGAPPATLSARVLQKALRGELGYQGIIITDALDMGAIQQGDKLGAEAVRAAKAGADLLLVTSSPEDQGRVHAALIEAADNGMLTPKSMNASYERVMQLKKWLSEQPAAQGPEVIRSAEHMRTAQEIADRSITLVRDHENLLPIQLDGSGKIAVVVPKPEDLTPADTSSHVVPKLAEAIRKFHPNVKEISMPYAPEESDVRLLLEALVGYDLIIIGTLNAFNQTGQAEVVREVHRRGKAYIVLATRLPYDLVAFPGAPTYLCSYGLLEPSMQAAAKCLFGQMEIRGHLPAGIPGLHPAGYSMNR